MPSASPSGGNVLPELPNLSVKERAFVLGFLESMNIRDAAKAAGYSPNYGYALVNKPHIKKAVSGLLDDRVMSMEEALARLSEMARADIRDVLSVRPKRDLDGDVVFDEEGAPEVECVIDPKKAIDAGKSFLIKEVGQTHEGYRVKLVDSYKALITILRFHGAFDGRLSVEADESFKKLFEEADPLSIGGGRRN